MKYNHPMYTNFMEILRYAVEKLKERGNSTMEGEVIRTIERTEQNFYFNKDDLKLTLNFILGENYIMPYTGSDNMNPDEKFAVQAVLEDNGPQATSTEAGKKAVRKARKRLKEIERLRPKAEAQAVLDAKKKAVEDKARVAKEAKDELGRPDRELSEAEREVKKATAALKKAEEEVGV